MKDISHHRETLISIAGIGDTFKGRYHLREIVNSILPTTASIFAEARRPYFDPLSVSPQIDRASALIGNLTLDKDLFSVSFDYRTRRDNDELVYLLEKLWFEFEQPCFVFFQDDSQGVRTIKPKMSWTYITETWSCFVLFKSAEHDVVWVGKSKGVRLPPGLAPDETR